jgi:hypothetical protein
MSVRESVIEGMYEEALARDSSRNPKEYIK